MRRRIAAAGALLIGIVGGGSFWISSTEPSRSDIESAKAIRSAKVKHDAPSSAEALQRLRSSYSLGGIPSVGSSPDDPLYFAEVKVAAENGDPQAQRELSTIYGECMSYSLSPQRYAATLDSLAAKSPASARAIASIKARHFKLCSAVDGGDVIPANAYSLWLEAAAESGDVVAEIRREARSLEPLSDERYVQLASSAIAEQDPQALFDLGDLLARVPQDRDIGRYNSVSGTPYAGYAWGIVACRLGLPCGAGSRIMDSLCVNTGACNHSSYESFVYSELVPIADRRRVQGLVAEVEEVVVEDL